MAENEKNHFFVWFPNWRGQNKLLVFRIKTGGVDLSQVGKQFSSAKEIEKQIQKNINVGISSGYYKHITFNQIKKISIQMDSGWARFWFGCFMKITLEMKHEENIRLGLAIPFTLQFLKKDFEELMSILSKTGREIDVIKPNRLLKWIFLNPYKKWK
jgi:hypothetical protein